MRQRTFCLPTVVIPLSSVSFRSNRRRRREVMSRGVWVGGAPGIKQGRAAELAALLPLSASFDPFDCGLRSAFVRGLVSARLLRARRGGALRGRRALLR